MANFAHHWLSQSMISYAITSSSSNGVIRNVLEHRDGTLVEVLDADDYVVCV